MIKGYEYQSDFARKYYGQGREEGREEGCKEGREKGLREAVIALARTKLDLGERDLAAIEAVSDPSVLTAIITSLGDARDAVAARSALDRALHRTP